MRNCDIPIFYHDMNVWCMHDCASAQGAKKFGNLSGEAGGKKYKKMILLINVNVRKGVRRGVTFWELRES